MNGASPEQLTPANCANPRFGGPINGPTPPPDPLGNKSGAGSGGGGGSGGGTTETTVAADAGSSELAVGEVGAVKAVGGGSSERREPAPVAYDRPPSSPNDLLPVVLLLVLLVVPALLMRRPRPRPRHRRTRVMTSTRRAILAAVVVVTVVVLVAIVAKRGSDTSSSATGTTLGSTSTTATDSSSTSETTSTTDGSISGPTIPPPDPNEGGATGPRNAEGNSVMVPLTNLPADVTVDKKSGLSAGDTVTVHITAKSGSKIFGADARLCRDSPVIANSADYAPTQGGQCVAAPLSADSDAFVELQGSDPYTTLDVPFRVGTGTSSYQMQDGTEVSITCGPGHPCTLIVKLQVPDGFGFESFDLSFG